MNHGRQGKNGATTPRIKNEYILCDGKWWPPSNLVGENQNEKMKEAKI
jgi:hypothetical protein